MNRRQFLGSGAALTTAAIAGCTGAQSSAGVGTVPTASLRMRPIADVEIAEEVTYDSSVGDSHTVDTDVITEGSTTAKATEPPFPENRPFVFNGSIYELSYEVTDSRPATSFHIILDLIDDTVESSEVVQYQDLPAVDKEVFRGRGWDDIEFIGFGTSILYLNDQIPDSVLVPDPEYSVIAWSSETRGRFSVEGSHETALKTYQYTSSVVNESAEDYGQSIREQREFAFESLTAEQREILSEATADESGFVIPREKALSEAMKGLVNQFRPQKQVDWVWNKDEENESVSGRYLVRYKGDVYLARLHVSQSSETAVTEETSATETKES